MKIRNHLSLLCACIFLLGAVSVHAADSTPIDSVKATIDKVIETLKDTQLSAPERKKERRAKISALIRERFDFTEMARRSLARHWKDRSVEEKKEFVAIFSDLLELSYIGKIEGYTDEKVSYDKEVLKGDGKYGVVDTTIVTKDVNIPISYKVKRKNNEWWIYDVVVEGVSFISTYRSQYNKVITRESYAQLIDKMKTKLNEVNAL
jgi:phospholipid transport system substrate-binding protein